MAINTTWSVQNMTRVDADGGVIKVYWACNAESDAGGAKVQLRAVKTFLLTMHLLAILLLMTILLKLMYLAGYGKPIKRKVKLLKSTKQVSKLTALFVCKIKLTKLQHKRLEYRGNE